MKGKTYTCVNKVLNVNDDNLQDSNDRDATLGVHCHLNWIFNVLMDCLH